MSFMVSRQNLSSSYKGSARLNPSCIPWMFSVLANLVRKMVANLSCSYIAIATVEVTASAKVFFETHFNNILGTEITPRSQRRRAFELRLLSQSMTSEQRAMSRSKWAKRESEHLRQMRSLKTRPLDVPGVFVAGYEVIKVLGKGSFGVVRLVKESQSFLGSKDTSIEEADLMSPGYQPASPQTVNFDTFHHLGKLATPFHRRKSEDVKQRVYAMKVIRKSDMLRNSQEGHLRAERDFLVASEGSRWIVPLVASFQDNTNLYLVMDYMLGGDFLGLLIREHTLDEDVTKWYIAEMILCIEEAHGFNWIHRDVKPDNFLISASGHLKISDFGLAFDGHWSHDQKYFHKHRSLLMGKLGIEVDGDTLDRKQGRAVAAMTKMTKVFKMGSVNRETVEDGYSEEEAKREGILNWRNRTGMRHMAKSTVGTSQYMAPEVIRGEKYDGRCDWWSVGIILFEVSIETTGFLSTEVADAHNA